MKGNIEAPISVIKKGWGHEEIYWNNEEYCGKKLVMNSGKKLSWHYHNLKDETFYVEKGAVRLYYSDGDDIKEASKLDLFTGNTFHVYRGLRHRLEAYENSVIFEFSSQHFDSDSIRLEKGD